MTGGRCCCLVLCWVKQAGAWPHFLLKRGREPTDQGYGVGKGGRLLVAGVVTKAAASLNLQQIAKGAAAILAIEICRRAWLACTACGNPEKIADGQRTNQSQRAFPIEPSHSERSDTIAHAQTSNMLTFADRISSSPAWCAPAKCYLPNISYIQQSSQRAGRRPASNAPDASPAALLAQSLPAEVIRGLFL